MPYLQAKNMYFKNIFFHQLRRFECTMASGNKSNLRYVLSERLFLETCAGARKFEIYKTAARMDVLVRVCTKILFLCINISVFSATYALPNTSGGSLLGKGNRWDMVPPPIDFIFKFKRFAIASTMEITKLIFLFFQALIMTIFLIKKHAEACITSI